MTDLNISNSQKNNLTRHECKPRTDPLNSFDALHKNVTARSKNLKGTTEGNLCSNSGTNEKYVPPKSNLYPSLLSEDLNVFDKYATTSSDELVFVDADNRASVRNVQTKENSIVDELDRVFCVNKMKPSTTSLTSDVGVKFDVDNHSPNSKDFSSTNFFISGQLLNKKHNKGLSSKNSGNTKHSSPTNKQTQQSPSRNEVLESNDVPRTQMKTKLRSIWNNVKYGWRIKREVSLKTDSAIWLLGQCYHNKLNDDVALTQDVADQLRLDLLSKIWLTYRMNFPAIPGTNLVSDSGWGCMLRCGQMMMAQAFVCHFLQRDWRLASHQSAAKNQLYKSILRWFGDSLSDKSPFSLHHLVLLGENYGRKAGDWYGPTHAAHVLRDALCEAKKNNPLLQELCMYVASDGIVFKQDVLDLCLNSACKDKTKSNLPLDSDPVTVSLPENSSNGMLKNLASTDFLYNSDATSEEPESFETACPSYSAFGPPSYSVVKPSWKSLILFVSVRLGNDKINPFYIPCLKSLLAYEHCIGIIGGRPKHALYFIGWQDDKIIHMDPHSCQPAVDVEKDDFNEKSFHSSSIRMMSFSEMDPSCSIGFHFREYHDFEIFIERFSEITAPLKRNLEYPVFALADGKRIDVEDDICFPSEKRVYPPLRDLYADDGDDDNDYILL